MNDRTDGEDASRRIARPGIDSAGLTPIARPRLRADLPVVKGVFASTPEDFVVEERLAYEPSGEGTHVYLWIEKRDLTTFEAVRRIAQFLDRPTHDFGMAGLKDANAVTRQWLSIEHEDPERLRGWTIRDVKVLRAERNPHKLRLGHSKGNRFVVNILDVDTGQRATIDEILTSLSRSGLPNFFGRQRFGHGGSTLALGLALVRGELGLYERLSGLTAARTDRRLRSLHISAVQSELFNRVLARRMPKIGTLQTGDVAFLHVKGASFLVDSAAAEQPRADRFEISPSGPLLGTRLLRAAGAPGAIEEAVFAEAGLSATDFADLPLGHEAHGARRPLRVRVENLEWRHGDGHLWLSFALPSGSYATGVIKELLGNSDRENLSDPGAIDTP